MNISRYQKRCIGLGLLFLFCSCLPLRRDSDFLKASINEAFGVIGLLKEDEIDAQVPVGKGLPVTAGSRSSLDLTLETFRGVQLAQSYIQDIKETRPDKILKTEVFEFNAKVDPFKLVTKKDNFLFPFVINRNSVILVGRNFSSRRSAVSSGPFQLQDLPINVENAENLEIGDYVAIPVQMSVLASYSGQTLQSVFQKSGLLKTLISASAFESYSGAVQGSIVGQGDFTMHIIKVGPHKVRVRISTGNSLILSGGGSLSAGGIANVNFLPHSILERGRDLGRALRNIRSMVFEKKNQLAFNKTWQLLNPNQKKLANNQAWTLKLDILTQLAALSQKRDPALGQIPGSDPADDRASADLSKMAKERATKFGMESLDKIVKVTDQVEKIRAHSFQLSANVSLNVTESRVVHSLGEYIFDLTSEEGKSAFLHAVSGRAKWVGDDLATVLGIPSKGEGEFKALSDLTFAEQIAVQDQLVQKKRVERVQLANSKQIKSALNIQFNFANASTGFLEDKAKNQVSITDSGGQKTVYNLQTWRFQKKAFYAGLTDNEVKSSGFYSKTATDVLASYFYSWSYEKSNQLSAMRDPLKQLLNVLGPEFYRSKTHLVWPADYEGSTSAHMEVVVNQDAIKRFFDESLISEDDLWLALGQIADSWDNTFGLPYNSFGGLPGGNSSEEAKKACAIISKEWGGAYCKFFAEVFIPGWHLAAKKNSLDKVRFFSEFYQRGFLANKIGADLMMRIVLQVLGNSRANPETEDYMLKVESSPKGILNTNLVIDYDFGSDPLQSVSEVLGLKMLML